MSNAWNFTIGLAEVVKWSDVAYSVGRLLVLFIISFGLLYYLGRLSREGYKLKKPSRFETDLMNYAWGLLITLTLLTIVVIIALNVPPEMLGSPAILGLFGLVEWALIMALFIYLYSKKSGHAIKKTILEKLRGSIIFWFSLGVILPIIILFVLLVFVIPILILVAYPNQQQLFIYLHSLVILIAFPFLIGRFTRPPEHEVSVYLSDTAKTLENLVLYQTTDVDYRFRKGDEEIVIPISRVQKIVYKTPPKEDSKSVSSDRARSEATSEGG